MALLGNILSKEFAVSFETFMQTLIKMTILFQQKKTKDLFDNVTHKMTSSSHITTCSLLFILSLKSALGAINLTDLVISDYDFNDPDNDRVSCTNVH